MRPPFFHLIVIKIAMVYGARYLFLTFFIMLAAFIYFVSKHSSLWQDQRNDYDPKIVAVLGERNILNEPLKELNHRPPYLIINFWATWCPPCISETPSLIRFVSERKNQFSFIAVSEDDKTEDVFNFVKLFPLFSELAPNIIFDLSKKISRAFDVEKLPETFVYSFKKKKILQISGSIDWSEPGLENKIKTQLGE